MLAEVRAWIRREQGHGTCDRPGETRRADCLSFQRIVSGSASDVTTLTSNYMPPFIPLRVALHPWRWVSLAQRVFWRNF